MSKMKKRLFRMKRINILISSIIICILFSLLGTYATCAAADYGHPASEVSAGSFNEGDYSFPGTSNVGIGTTSPAYPLEIVRDGENSALVLTRSDGASGYFNAVSSYVNLGSISSHPLRFVTDSTVKMFIDTDGKVGIGTTSPESKLHIYDASSAVLRVESDNTVELDISRHTTDGYGGILDFYKTRGSKASRSIVAQNDDLGAIRWSAYDGNSDEYVALILAEVDNTPGDEDMPTRMLFKTTPDGSSTAVTAMTIDSTGNVGIGTTSPSYKLQVAGDVGATGFFYSSDERLKTDVEPIEDALEKVLQLEGVSFRWKENNKSSLGLIAQDAEKVFPELVSTASETGMKSVEYGNLVAPLIEAIKEQQKQIEKLEAEIEELKQTG